MSEQTTVKTKFSIQIEGEHDWIEYGFCHDRGQAIRVAKSLRKGFEWDEFWRPRVRIAVGDAAIWGGCSNEHD